MFVFKIENQNQYLCISAEMERSSMQDDNYLEHESFFASKEDILNENLQVLFFNEEKSKEYLNKINTSGSFYLKNKGINGYGIIDGVHCHTLGDSTIEREEASIFFSKN